MNLLVRRSPSTKHTGGIPLEAEEIACSRSLCASGDRPSARMIFKAPIVVAAVFAAVGMAATPPFAGADTFIQKNCASCHNSSAPAARLDLSKLTYEPANPDNFATWVKIHDRVS